MKQLLSFIVLLFLAYSAHADGCSKLLGNGTKANPFKICTLAQLLNMELDATASYELTSDIDASSTRLMVGGFAPLFSQTTVAFQGSLEGNGHVISNLVINRPKETNVAFISACEHCSIKNLTLQNVNVIGGGYTAGLIADYSVEDSALNMNADPQIENVKVSGQINGDYRAGGVFGEVYNMSADLSDGVFIKKNVTFEGIVTETVLHSSSSQMTGSYEHD